MRSFLVALFLFSLGSPDCLAGNPIRLVPGFVYKFRCEGRLLVSAIGDSNLIRLEALPKEIGCGVLVKPLGAAGTTDLLLETSTGSIRKIIEVSSSAAKPTEKDLEIWARPEEEL